MSTRPWPVWAHTDAYRPLVDLMLGRDDEPDDTDEGNDEQVRGEHPGSG